jgi:amidase
LTDRVIARIERLDPRLNAVIARDFERAREAEKAADAALARGERLPLLGVPMTVKESFNVAGLPTTWGIPQARGFIAEDDALVVARARSAGAVVLGKTNVPLNLFDWQTYNAIHGVTRNPWDLERTPGGSSGGSAAALAAGFGALSLGSDLGGSLRVPAHFTGVAALKPSLGVVPSRGHTPPGLPPLPRESDLAVVGPMARSAADLARLFDVIAGPDEVTAGVGYKLALRPSRHQELRSFRVLLVDQHPLVPTSSPVRLALERLAGALERAGVRVHRSHRLLPAWPTSRGSMRGCWCRSRRRPGRATSTNGCAASPRRSRPMTTASARSNCVVPRSATATGCWPTPPARASSSNGAPCSPRSTSCCVPRCR